MSASRLKLSVHKRKVADSLSVLDAADDFEDEETIFRIPVPKRAKQDRSSSGPPKPRGRPKKSRARADIQSKDKGQHKTEVCRDEVTASAAGDAVCNTDKGSDDDIEVLCQYDVAKEHGIELQENLKELEESLSSPTEKLCLCCKLVVPTDIFTSHFKDCIQKFKHGPKSDADHPSCETPGGSNQDQFKDVIQCPICLTVTDEKVTQEHIDTCAAEHGMTHEQVLQAVSLHKKQTGERRSLGLPTHPTKLQKEITEAPSGSDKPKRKCKKKDGTNDPEFQMAVALSSSLAQEEDHKRFVMEEKLVEMGLSNIVEEDRKTQLLLPYDKVEKAGRSTTGRKGAQAARKGKVLALYSPRKRQHIISEKVAAILSVTEECMWNMEDGLQRGKKKLKSKALSRFHDEHSSLWDVSSQTAEEELESYFVTELQDFIKPKQLVVGRLFRRLSQIPGRLNTTKMAVCSDSESEDQDNEEVDEASLESSGGDTYCTQLALAELLSSQSRFEMTVAEELDSFQIDGKGEELHDQNYEYMEPASGFWIEHGTDDVQEELDEAVVSSKLESSKSDESPLIDVDRHCPEVLNIACTNEEIEMGDTEKTSQRKETGDVEMIDISDSPVENKDEGNVPDSTFQSQVSYSGNKEMEVENSQTLRESLDPVIPVYNDKICLKVSQDTPLKESLCRDIENLEIQHNVLSEKYLLLNKEKDTDSSLKEDIIEENESCHLSKEMPDSLHEGKDQVDKKVCEKGSNETKTSICVGVKSLGQGHKSDCDTHKNEPEKKKVVNDFGGGSGVLCENNISIDDYHVSEFNQTMLCKNRKNGDENQGDGSVCYKGCDVNVECEENHTETSKFKESISKWDNDTNHCKVMRAGTCSNVSQTIFSVKISDSDLPSMKSLNANFVQSWASLLASGKCSDVKIRTQSDEIKTHFLVLLVRCLLLYEEAHKNQGSVNWEDYSYEGALEFLSFLYTGQCSLTSKEDLHWMEVFDLALKYKCQDLVEYLQKLYIDSPKKDDSHTSPPQANPVMENNYESSELSSQKIKERKRSMDTSQSSLETVMFDASKVNSPSHQSLDERMPNPVMSSGRVRVTSSGRISCSSSNLDSDGTQSPDLFDENMPVNDNVSFISTPKKSPIGSDVSFISTPRKSPLTFPLMTSSKSNLNSKSFYEVNTDKSPIRMLLKRTKGCYDMSASSEQSLHWRRNLLQNISPCRGQHETQKCVPGSGIDEDEVREALPDREGEDLVSHTKLAKKLDYKAAVVDNRNSRSESSLYTKENQQKVVCSNRLYETSEELKTPEKVCNECEVLSFAEKQKFAERDVRCNLHTPGKQDSGESLEGNHKFIVENKNVSLTAELQSSRVVDKEIPWNSPEERINSPRVNECNESVNQPYISNIWDDYENLGFDTDIVCIPPSEKKGNKGQVEKESCDEIQELEPASNLNVSKSAHVSLKTSELTGDKFQKSKIGQHKAVHCTPDKSPSHFTSKDVRNSESPCYSKNICSDDSSTSDLNDDVNHGLKVCGPSCSNETLMEIAKEFNNLEYWTSKMDMSWEKTDKEIGSPSSKIKNAEIVSLSSKTGNVRKNDLTSVVEINEAAETPVVKTKTKKSDVTPLPNYKEMLSPELKKELSKYGIRPISKRKAVLLLNHIYERTHPLVTDSEPDTSYNETPKKAADKTDKIGQSKKKDVKKVTASSKTKQGPNNSKKLKTQNQAKEQVLCTSQSDENVLNSSQTSSTGSEGSELECAEETMLAVCSEEDFNTPTQKDDIHSCITKFLESNTDLHNKILLYEPIWIEELHSSLKENGIKCNMATLLHYLDEKCITFRTKQNKIRTRKKSKRKEKKQASPTT